MAAVKASHPSTVASHGLLAAMLRRPLLFYFLLAYSGSWIVSIPIVLSEWGHLPKALFVPLFFIKPFVGPFLAAYIMTRVTEGKEGWRRLRRSLFQIRVGWQWIAMILLGIPALFLLTIVLLPDVGSSFQGFPNSSLVYFLVFYLVNFVLIFFGGGPLGEEPGWRGFALPRMQARFGALGGTLFLGVIWAFWHLPDFLTSAQGGGPGTGWSAFYTNLPIFLVMVVAISIIMTWVYNHNRASLFIMVLLHASINTSGILPELFAPQNMSQMTLGNLAMLIPMVVAAVLIVALTRRKLGYQVEQAGV